ncbi:TPA: hypothetical protein ACHOY0_001605 [Raoultella ornithinolytica]
MKKITVVLSLVFLAFSAHAKTVSDFINEHPELAKKPTIKTAIQQIAIGNAGMEAVSNGATSGTLAEDSQKLLAENGYDFAQGALRELATTGCSDNGLADIYGLREKDCQIIIKVDSEIE